jgi:hypothetical protein
MSFFCNRHDEPVGPNMNKAVSRQGKLNNDAKKARYCLAYIQDIWKSKSVIFRRIGDVAQRLLSFAAACSAHLHSKIFQFFKLIARVLLCLQLEFRQSSYNCW